MSTGAGAPRSAGGSQALTTPLERRLRRLEIDKPANANGPVRLVLVPHGADPVAERRRQLAGLDPLEEAQIMEVRFVRAGKVQALM